MLQGLLLSVDMGKTDSAREVWGVGYWKYPKRARKLGVYNPFVRAIPKSWPPQAIASAGSARFGKVDFCKRGYVLTIVLDLRKISTI